MSKLSQRLERLERLESQATVMPTFIERLSAVLNGKVLVDDWKLARINEILDRARQRRYLEVRATVEQEMSK